MSEINLYAVLGVNKEDTITVIKVAYRKLANVYHPDKSTGDADKFKQIRMAWEVLSDITKRRVYDDTGRIDNGVNNEEAMLRSSLVGLLISIIDSYEDMARMNLLEDAKNRLQGEIKKNEQMAVNTEKLIAKREKVLGRLICTCGENIVAIALQTQIEQFKNQAVEIEKAIAGFNHMIEMLGDYKYEVDGSFVPRVDTSVDISHFLKQAGYFGG